MEVTKAAQLFVICIHEECTQILTQKDIFCLADSNLNTVNPGINTSQVLISNLGEDGGKEGEWGWHLITLPGA